MRGECWRRLDYLPIIAEPRVWIEPKALYISGLGSLNARTC